MSSRSIQLKSLLIVIFIAVPLLITFIPSTKSSIIQDVNCKQQLFSISSPVLTPGQPQYLDITLRADASKITIIAFCGNIIPNPEDRSCKNYYRWQYNNGEWRDISGHLSTYIFASKCLKENNTYSFYLKLDTKANGGQWTIRIMVDGIEVSSEHFLVETAIFNLFISSIIGVFQPRIDSKRLFSNSDLICCDRKRTIIDSEENIEEAVDKLLKERALNSHKEESEEVSCDTIFFDETPSLQNELMKSSVFTYPRSKLKNKRISSFNSLIFNKKMGGGHGFQFKKLFNQQKFLTVLLALILLAVAFMPIITSIVRSGDPPEINIINVQSFPVVGGEWTVMFTTIGNGNLTISAVNGTTWNDTSEDYDLKFLEIKSGNETLEYEWINDSVFIENYSSNETGYEISKVFTPGVHTLMFCFGNDVAFANNLASEYWLQTTTSDFNNGTKNNINISGDAFHLNETYYIRNTSLIYNESFEGSWPPNGWTAENQWNRESDQVYDGLWSADFDGSSSGGGQAGNLVTSSMDCSDTENISAIYVSFYGRADGADNGDYYLDYYDGNGWDQISRLDNFGVGGYAQYTDKIIDTQYFVSDFQIRWRVVELKNGENVYVDLVNITLEKNIIGYVTSGSLISEAHDSNRNVPDYNNIVVDNSTPSGTTITTWIRSADTQANLSTATWYIDINQVSDERWAQWRINLTGDEDNTPTVNEVNLSWTYDDEDPSSSVNAISPYWQNSIPFEITATASDTGGSGIKEVALYYNFSLDNISWGSWTLFGTNDTIGPYNWSFTAPLGDGYYQFYSIAIDNENNIETTPPGYDNISGADTVDPISEVDDLLKYWHNEADNPLDINVSSVTDTLSGVKNVTLYYKYRVDNTSLWEPFESFGTDTSAPWQWSFNFPDGAGHYAFYSIATDNASNDENPPGSPDNDTHCGYTTTKPSSEVDTITPYWDNTSPITITGQANDFSGTGLKNVTLYYYNSSDNSSWSDAWNYGVDNDPWVDISWSFDFPNGTGYYRFYSIAIDNNTNVEDFTGNDTQCGHDTSSPSSQVDTITSYWNNASDNPLVINVTTYSDDLSGIKNITLYWWNSTDNASWSGPWSNGTDSTSPYSWSFTFSNGSGYYRFYSLAEDKAGNREAIPVSNDTKCGYDTTKPSSQVDPISPYWKYEFDNPITIDVTTFSDDLSGVKNITLYYKYRVDNSSSWGSWTSYGVDTISPWSWSFSFQNGEGHYAFYSIAIDNASNFEDPPGTPDNDTRCGYELLTSFTDSLWSESNAVTAGLLLTSSNNADGSVTGTWADADGQWAQSPYESWTFTIENATRWGPINNVWLYLKHNQTGWVDDNFLIQIYNGSNWYDVRAYVDGDGPPTVDTTDNWDVKILGVDTWEEIDATQVRIIGNGKEQGEDTVDWFVDTVELRIEAQYVNPVINSYNLSNSTGSKLNNLSGQLDVNNEYYFVVNITDVNGWTDIDYINIKSWYDNGSDITTYNQTQGGNLNMFLQYENTTGITNFSMLWPDNEAQLILGNCTETIINKTTRIINISFIPGNQVRWAAGDGAWDTTQNAMNDPWSWNFNITSIDTEGKKNSKIDEYGVYRFTSILPASDWVDVIAAPGFSDSSNIVTVTYSSNYDFNMSVYFENNLTNMTLGDFIGIKNNVTILADADPNDDITENKQFYGIGEINAIDIFNDSGIFYNNGISQTVDVQFSVFIPMATITGKYTARVATRIVQD
jgi:hypothetical protein